MKERINNLLKKIDTVNPELFIQPEEKILYNAINGGSFFEGCVENFFDKVFIMDENPTIRNNRIALLRMLSNSYYMH